MAEITIIIPHRRDEKCDESLLSLSKQTFKDFVVLTIEDYEGKGACHARNRGFQLAPHSKYVLFSDNDVIWYEKSLEYLYKTLEKHPEAAYSYGGFMIYNRQIERQLRFMAIDFDPEKLKRLNYINTGSLIRWDDFPGFDENLKRYQDWDIWLNLLFKGKPGVSCGMELFGSILRKGISTQRKETMDEAEKYIKDKYKL